MNKKLIASAVLVLSSSVSAQSAFEGFYGQISTGYENNTVNNTDIAVTRSRVSNALPAQNFTDSNGGNATAGGMPLIVGLGYTFSLTPTFTLGLGADYSTLSTTTNTIQYTPAGGRTNLANYKISNRYNIFLTPGYAIDKDKLAYFKAGYTNQKLEGFDGTSGLSEGSSNMSGYVLGLGYKQMITSGFYGFAEANYYNYSKVNLNSSGITQPPALRAGGTFTNAANPGANAYNFLVGVGYKF